MTFRLAIVLLLVGCTPDFTEEQVAMFTLDEVRDRCRLLERDGPREFYKCGTIDVVLNDNPPTPLSE